MGYYESHFIDKETEVEDAACLQYVCIYIYIIHTLTHTHISVSHIQRKKPFENPVDVCTWGKHS